MAAAPLTPSYTGHSGSPQCGKLRSDGTPSPEIQHNFMPFAGRLQQCQHDLDIGLGQRPSCSGRFPCGSPQSCRRDFATAGVAALFGDATSRLPLASSINSPSADARISPRAQVTIIWPIRWLCRRWSSLRTVGVTINPQPFFSRPIIAPRASRRGVLIEASPTHVAHPEMQFIAVENRRRCRLPRQPRHSRIQEHHRAAFSRPR